MGFKIEKSLKISTAIALTTSMLVMAVTLVIAIYSIYFVDKIFAPLAFQNNMTTELLGFNNSLQQLVLICLFFAIIASYFMTKIIINPIIDLVKGSKELSEGNFGYRFRKTSYLEINKLMGTYNQMAENLQTLYNDLEHKVQERTKELEDANNEIKNAQVMMVHSEKMRSLGQLVAGITHEINNPINFIHGNMTHLKNYSEALIDIINLYETCEINLNEEERQKINELKDKIELDFIKEDLPMLIKSCYEGTERTKNIILDLKSFSRLDELVINSIDLPKEIDTTLNILHNKIKGRIEIIKEYADDIPLVEGYGGQLNQVFMNVLDNACYAIKDKGSIYIRLQKKENNVIIEFEDTGCGMKKEHADKIFDPFYTTKPVGVGTGLGLSISYKVIQKHNGIISVESTEGNGTKFKIQLPLKLQTVKK